MRKLNEKFDYSDLTDDEKDELYKNFSDTYIDSTGASFSRHEFDWRANNWEFYGTIEGGVTVRPQKSGLLKLTSSYESIDPATGKHNTAGVLKGLEDLMTSNPNTGIWGAMSPQMAKMLTLVSKRKCPNNVFTPVPAPLVILLGPKLMKSTGSMDVVNIVKDPFEKDFGCIVVDTPAGPMAKKLVANQAYYDWLAASASDRSNTMIQDVIAKLGGITKFLNLLPGSKKADDDEFDLDDYSDDEPPADDADGDKLSLVNRFLNKFHKDEE